MKRAILEVRRPMLVKMATKGMNTAAAPPTIMHYEILNLRKLTLAETSRVFSFVLNGIKSNSGA